MHIQKQNENREEKRKKLEIRRRKKEEKNCKNVEKKFMNILGKKESQPSVVFLLNFFFLFEVKLEKVNKKLRDSVRELSHEKQSASKEN